MEPEVDELLIAKAQAKRVIYDIYGKDTLNGKVMIGKLNKCTNQREIDKVLAWGRTNLL